MTLSRMLPERYDEIGLQHPREYSQSPDAVLVAADGYAVTGTVDGDSLVTSNTEARTAVGSHGFLASLPKMKAMCVLAGAGIRPGTHLSNVENIDIAPTIAQLLDIDYPAADGQSLSDAERRAVLSRIPTRSVEPLFQEYRRGASSHIKEIALATRGWFS